MIKILETLNEEQSHDKVTQMLYTIDNDKFKVTDVDIVDKEKYVIFNFHLIVKELTPNIFNEFYQMVAEILFNNGYTSNSRDIGLSVRYFIFDHESGLSVEGIDVLPRESFNHLKYDFPSVYDIIRKQYSFVIPPQSIPNMDEDLTTIIRSKKKKSMVYYTLLKKGKIGGSEYELIDEPKIKIRTKGGPSQVFNPVNITPEIETLFKSIDGIPHEDENFPHHLVVHIADVLKEKFKKQNIDIYIFD
jgi:hypothetical protein